MLSISFGKEVIHLGMTKQRKLVLQILSDYHEHMTVEQIYDHAKQVLPNIGMGTIYRNVNMLADEGIIRRLQIIGQPVRFDVNTVPHQHTVCVKCGSISDIRDIEFSVIQELIDRQIKIVDHTLYIYIICKNCSYNFIP